jgi:hypothetical protein
VRAEPSAAHAGGGRRRASRQRPPGGECACWDMGTRGAYVLRRFCARSASFFAFLARKARPPSFYVLAQEYYITTILLLLYYYYITPILLLLYYSYITTTYVHSARSRCGGITSKLLWSSAYPPSGGGWGAALPCLDGGAIIIAWSWADGNLE